MEQLFCESRVSLDYNYNAIKNCMQLQATTLVHISILIRIAFNAIRMLV